MAAGDSKRGVGGWLLLFVIIYSGLAPLVELTAVGIQFFGLSARMIARLPALALQRNLLVMQVAVQIAVEFFVGYRLCRVFTPLSVRIAIAALWLLGPLTTGLGMTVRKLATGWNWSQWTHAFTISGTQVLVFATVSTVYFLRSSRVANTYYPDDKDKELAATFA